MSSKKRINYQKYQDSDEDQEDDDADIIETDDEVKSISFEALSRAQKSLEQENDHYSDSGDHSSSESAPEESGTSRPLKKKGSKHAPSEASTKKPVSWFRDIPGLKSQASSQSHGLYRDIRFDPTYGKSDLARTRHDYAFLNDYRLKEIQEMKDSLKKEKRHGEQEKLSKAIQSLESRLKTLKDRDFEQKVIQDHNNTIKKAPNSSRYYLKRCECNTVYNYIWVIL